MLGALGALAVGSIQPDRQEGTPALTINVESFGGERAVTKPSRDAVMGFTLSTSVRELLVTGGQRVRAGDVLVRGDDVEDRAEAIFQRARAETELPVARARAQADLAQLEFDRASEAMAQDGISQAEFDRARVALETAKIDRELALLNQVLSALQADRADARAEKLSLRAPFDGVIDIIQVDVGQSVRDGEPVVRVVSPDPIWIDVPAPTALTISLGLAPGAPAWVLTGDDPGGRVFIGEVIEVAPTADAASGTRRVRVAMRNEAGVVPGVNCWVRFTEPTGDWLDRVTDPARAPAALRTENDR